MVQVLSLHQSSPGYNAPVLLQRLGALHKDQVFGVPPKHDPDQPAKPASPTRIRPPTAGRRPRRAAGSPPGAPPIGPVRWILKVFALGAGAGLIVSTLLGLYMAFQVQSQEPLGARRPVRGRRSSSPRSSVAALPN